MEISKPDLVTLLTIILGSKVLRNSFDQIYRIVRRSGGVISIYTCFPGLDEYLTESLAGMNETLFDYRVKLELFLVAIITLEHDEPIELHLLHYFEKESYFKNKIDLDDALDAEGYLKERFKDYHYALLKKRCEDFVADQFDHLVIPEHTLLRLTDITNDITLESGWTKHRSLLLKRLPWLSDSPIRTEGPLDLSTLDDVAWDFVVLDVQQGESSKKYSGTSLHSTSSPGPSAWYDKLTAFGEIFQEYVRLLFYLFPL